MTRWRFAGGRARDRGAAAVEFALVLPVLMLLVMGILDYGRFFFDSVSLRQGAREAARQAVVMSYGACTVATPTALVGAQIACAARAASDTTMGTPVVYIPAISGGWAQGKQLLVCMQSKEQGTGFVPLPANGILRTKTYMSIELNTPASATTLDPSYSGDPAQTAATSDWSWCT
jgi:Flp pilus assembly protein TadG